MSIVNRQDSSRIKAVAFRYFIIPNSRSRSCCFSSQRVVAGTARGKARRDANASSVSPYHCFCRSSMLPTTCSSQDSSQHREISRRSQGMNGLNQWREVAATTNHLYSRSRRLKWVSSWRRMHSNCRVVISSGGRMIRGCTKPTSIGVDANILRQAVTFCVFRSVFSSACSCSHRGE